MNKIIMFGLSLMIIGSGLEACVIYSPSTGNYTVDKSGCIKSTSPVRKSIRQNK